MADKHTAAIWTGGGALIAAGGIFMAVTGFEPTKKPATVWTNSWFDLGFAFVILGLLITGVGVALHFRKEAEPDTTPPVVNPDEFNPSLAPLPPPELGRETSPIKMAVVDEDWSLIEDKLWAFAIAVQVENKTDETVLITDISFTNLDDGDRNAPVHERFQDIWPAVSRETKHLFDAHLIDGHSGIFESNMLFKPNQPEVLWYIGEALPPHGGGRPRFTFTLNDSLGNSYDMDVDRRPAQRFRA
jgi:hypothetical protein